MGENYKTDKDYLLFINNLSDNSKKFFENKSVSKQTHKYCEYIIGKYFIENNLFKKIENMGNDLQILIDSLSKDVFKFNEEVDKFCKSHSEASKKELSIVGKAYFKKVEEIYDIKLVDHTNSLRDIALEVKILEKKCNGKFSSLNKKFENILKKSIERLQKTYPDLKNIAIVIEEETVFFSPEFYTRFKTKNGSLYYICAIKINGVKSFINVPIMLSSHAINRFIERSPEEFVNLTSKATINEIIDTIIVSLLKGSYSLYYDKQHDSLYFSCVLGLFLCEIKDHFIIIKTFISKTMLVGNQKDVYKFFLISFAWCCIDSFFRDDVYKLENYFNEKQMMEKMKICFEAVLNYLLTAQYNKIFDISYADFFPLSQEEKTTMYKRQKNSQKRNRKKAKGK